MPPENDQSQNQNTAEGAGNNTGSGNGQQNGQPSDQQNAQNQGQGNNQAQNQQGQNQQNQQQAQQSAQDGVKLFSQADLDRIVKERLQEEQKRAERKLSDAQKQADDAKLREQGEFKTLADQYKARVEELEVEIKRKERESLCLKIASEEKLPADLAPRLMGDDEAAIRVDAQRLFKLMAPPTPPNAQGGKQGNGSASVFDKVREDAKKDREVQQGKPLEEILGIKPGAHAR